MIGKIQLGPDDGNGLLLPPDGVSPAPDRSPTATSSTGTWTVPSVAGTSAGSSVADDSATGTSAGFSAIDPFGTIASCPAACFSVRFPIAGVSAAGTPDSSANLAPASILSTRLVR